MYIYIYIYIYICVYIYTPHKVYFLITVDNRVNVNYSVYYILFNAS